MKKVTTKLTVLGTRNHPSRIRKSPTRDTSQPYIVNKSVVCQNNIFSTISVITIDKEITNSIKVKDSSSKI